jgi:hypothetical protein
MTDGGDRERRRQMIQARIATGSLPAALSGEEPTWIPSAYALGGGPATCHYCGEAIGAAEAILVRDGERTHPSCEEAWRDLVTGQRGEEPG